MTTKGELHDAIYAEILRTVPRGTRIVAKDIGPTQVTRIADLDQMKVFAAQMVLRVIFGEIEEFQDDTILSSDQVATVRRDADDLYCTTAEGMQPTAAAEQIQEERTRVLAVIDRYLLSS